jgi:Alginate export
MSGYRVAAVIIALVVSLFFVRSGHAEEAQGVSGGKVPRSSTSCTELSTLADRYGIPLRLPDTPMVEKKDLAAYYLVILGKIRTKLEAEGRQAVPQEDIDCLAHLDAELKEELAGDQGYQTLRETVEKMLARPEVPAFVYKAGVAGFLRGEGAGNFRLTDFSATPGHGEGRFLYRVKPYVYWHPTVWLDIHAEGQGYGFTGGSSQEQNNFSLYQGFVEAKLPDREWLALKGGRQEFSYGSAFIIGTDSFYNGLTFDAGRLRVKPADPFTIDILAGAYAAPFADGVGGSLAGTYASWALAEGNAVDFYAFRDSGSTNHHPGEKLYVWGGRLTARKDDFSLEFEPVYESGLQYSDFLGGARRIDAFGGHLDLNIQVNLAGQDSNFFTSFAYGSGSKDAAGGVSSAREFRNPDNNSSLIGDMHVFGDLSGVTVNGLHASGLQVYTLGWGIDIAKEVNFSATGRNFVANNVPDGFSPYLGLETDFTLTWSFSEKMVLVAGYDRFFTGAFFHNASGSGRDIDYGYVMLQFDLSTSKPRLNKI